VEVVRRQRVGIGGVQNIDGSCAQQLAGTCTGDDRYRPCRSPRFARDAPVALRVWWRVRRAGLEVDHDGLANPWPSGQSTPRRDSGIAIEQPCCGIFTQHLPTLPASWVDRSSSKLLVSGHERRNAGTFKVSRDLVEARRVDLSRRSSLLRVPARVALSAMVAIPQIGVIVGRRLQP
jgi:hypothetical protein